MKGVRIREAGGKERGVRGEAKGWREVETGQGEGSDQFA